MADLLELESVRSGYGDLVVVRDVSFTVAESSITVLLGRNGAGKTTLLRTVAGLNPTTHGDVRFAGASIIGDPAHRRGRHGIGFVQENKRVFRKLTVEKNLVLATYGLRLGRVATAARVAEAFDRFPVLGERRRDVAGLLSGGQQQMLAIAQALIRHPRLVLLDEPFSGLAPAIVHDVMEAVSRIRAEEGRTLLIVEQAVALALSIADAVVVMDVGTVVHTGRANDPDIHRVVEDAYFSATM